MNLPTDNQADKTILSAENSVADEPPSKSQRKRDAVELTALGATISELGEADIRRLPLDEDVLEAVMTLRSITSNSARKRQRHYLGKLLRSRDTTALNDALIELQQSANTATRFFHSVEQWRDELLERGDEKLAEFVQQYPAADRQQLRQLVRNARTEAEKNRPPKAARELFKLLRTTMS